MAKPGYLKYCEREVRHLSTVCPELGRVIDRLGFLERPVEPDLFTALASSIVSQQITGKVAQTIWGRLVKTAELKLAVKPLKSAVSPEIFSLLSKKSSEPAASPSVRQNISPA